MAAQNSREGRRELTALPRTPPAREGKQHHASPEVFARLSRHTARPATLEATPMPVQETPHRAPFGESLSHLGLRVAQGRYVACKGRGAGDASAAHPGLAPRSQTSAGMRLAPACACLMLLLPAAAWPQTLRLGGASLTLGGEASAALSEKGEDHFNDDGYDSDLLRQLRLRLLARLDLGSHVAVLSEIRSDDLGDPRVYALYLRLHPWRARALSLQAGRIPPVFGSFARRGYATDNALIGYPLGYQYLTILRDDASPASVAGLERWRGYGYYVRYPVGSRTYEPGLPLVEAQRWDTGIQVRVGSEPLSIAGAITQGTLSRPRVHDDNDGYQLVGRLAWRPVVGLELGVSAARGPYAETALIDALPEPRPASLRQTAWGLDAEYSWGYWLLRGEAIWMRSEVPILTETAPATPLDSASLFVEGRYRIRPGLYAAARGDHLGFETVRGTTRETSWDAPVWRVEAGVGYTPTRQVLLKAVYQHNWRDGGPKRSRGVLAGQVVVWF